MRVTRRRRLPVAPQVLWRRLADPRDWAPLFVSPETAAPKRVKLLDADRPAEGAQLQVLRSDHSWTVYRIHRWDPERQVRLVAVRQGTGQEEGDPVRGVSLERLILIPQAHETEAEWTHERRGALLSRLLLAPRPDAWSAALEARLDVLASLAPPDGPRPED